MKKLLTLSYNKIKEFYIRMYCELRNKPIPPLKKHTGNNHKYLYNTINNMTPETFASATFTTLGVILFLFIKITTELLK